MTAWYQSTEAISAVCGAFAGGIVSGAIWYFTSRSDRKHARFKECRDALLNVECTAAVYWRSVGRNEPVESLLKTLLEQMDVTLQQCKPWLGSDDYDRLQRFNDSVYEAVTRGSFESAARPSDTFRAKEIKAQCEAYRNALPH